MSDDGNSPLESITKGASLFLVGKVFSRGLRFLLNLIMTRGLGVSLYGVYAYAQTLLSFVIVLARLGTGKSLLKYIPEFSDDPDRRNRYLALASVTALAGSTLIGAALFVLAPMVNALTLDAPTLTPVLRVLALALPFNTTIKLINTAFRGLEKLEYQVFVSDIIHPIAQILVVAVALLLGYSLLGVVAALALGAVVVCLVAVTVLFSWTPLRPVGGLNTSRTELKEFYNFSVPLTLKDIGSLLYTRVDILMTGFFLAEAAVGIYRISFLLTGFLTLPLMSLNQLFPSVASRLYSRDRIDELRDIYRTATRWTLTATLPPTLAVSFYSSELLSLFGAEFSTGSAVLLVLAVGQLANSAVGPSGFLLMMTGHQYLNMVNQWVLGVLNIALNYVMILEFGLIGAAVATSAVLAFINVVRLAEIWYTEGLFPYSVAFWKPLVAGTACGAVMLLSRTLTDGYVLLFGGSAAGAVAFAATIWILGIEDRDREFFREVVVDKLD